MTDWLERARVMGFEAVPLDPQSLVCEERVRSACSADVCRAYGRSWTCPPAVGTLEECGDRLYGYHHGLLLQTVGHLSKRIDSRGMRDTEELHNRRLSELREEMLGEYPELLCLGAGGCRICKSCAYPEPCRYPERAFSSMEAYGLFVTAVCRNAGLPYYYGEKTISFTGCILF